MYQVIRGLIKDLILTLYFGIIALYKMLSISDMEQ